MPDGTNQRWSLVFVSDAFTNSQRFRILCIIDDFSRKCLALVADTSLSGARVARELGRIIDKRGKPKTIVSDNSTELTSMAILQWSQDRSVEWHYIAPVKPSQNAFVESFNRPKRATNEPGALLVIGGNLGNSSARQAPSKAPSPRCACEP